MLGAFANAFRTPDLRKKLLFVLLVVVIFRLGSQIPTPGVNVANVQACFDQTKNDGLYGLINLFSGERCSGSPSSRSASCRTSPRASSCSCWWW